MNKVLFYMNEPSLNDQDGLACIIVFMNLTIQTYLEEGILFIIYFEKRVKISLAVWATRNHL